MTTVNFRFDNEMKNHILSYKDYEDCFINE